VVPVSAVRGDGLLDLKRALLRLVQAAQPVPTLAEHL